LCDSKDIIARSYLNARHGLKCHVALTKIIIRNLRSTKVSNSNPAIGFRRTSPCYIFVGFLVGLPVGMGVGLRVGLIVGLRVGLIVGLRVGLIVGLRVGLIVGLRVGLIVGLSVSTRRESLCYQGTGSMPCDDATVLVNSNSTVCPGDRAEPGWTTVVAKVKTKNMQRPPRRQGST
jgi:hypothetical protein